MKTAAGKNYHSNTNFGQIGNLEKSRGNLFNNYIFEIGEFH
jgi:hypothetical protein